ncbi:hypothetical protein FRC08_000403 [Ceratobasidium sp. 394]|nr:hypothetical protein FRC08_000403 [Ceratobasidium sp. 394]
MDQHSSRYSRGGQSRNWGQENHPSQTNQQEDLSTTYGAGGQHEHSPLGGQPVAYQPWYQDGARAVHVPPNPEAEEHPPWQTYPSPAPRGYYNQEMHTNNHPPQYALQPSPQEQPYPTWSDRNSVVGDSERGYLHPQYPLPQSSPQGEQYLATPSLPVPNLGQPLPQPARGRRRDRATGISRSPSQTFGPYTTTILQSSGDTSAVGTPVVELTPSPIHTPYGEASRGGTIQAVPGTEPSAHTTEISQFVVPSSRIPRTEASPHPTVSSQASTPRTSHSPEVSTETKPKRRRANATQLQLLNETYARTMFPATEERAEIARRINMTPRQVQIWFQNRRQASRQTQVPDSPASLGSHNPGLPQQRFSGHPGALLEHHEGSSYSTGPGFYDVEREES